MHAVETEILAIPPLAPGEASLLDRHSLLNVVSVLYGELYVLADLLGAEAELAPALARCDTVRRDLVDPATGLRHAETIETHGAAIFALIDRALHAHAQRAAAAAVAESVGNIRSVFAVLAVRAQELVARSREPSVWLEMTIDDLRADFRQVFAAIEKNSHGRYRIIYNLAQQQPSDYYIDFQIESDTARTVTLPLVFKDVMRDLLANARKYTPVGGTINAGLYETEAALKFTVQDTGCGIPPAEIETVVHYGRRATNVLRQRTLGGGFGLTKAFLVTKQFGGRFWIASELGVGTRVRLEIPRPPA